MRRSIEEYFEISSPEIDLSVDIINGICESKEISCKGLSKYVRGDASPESKERRIERFYQHDYVGKNILLNAMQGMLGEEKFILSLDRTNWECVKEDINIFAAFGCQGEVGSLVDLKMLENKGGSSKSCERIELVGDVIARYGKERISCVVGDREFFSIAFADWLIEEDMGFAIRLKENLQFVQAYLRYGSRKGKTLRNVVITDFEGKELRCDLSIKVLQDEYLIIASSKVKNPLKTYKERWKIERFFKMLKT